MSGAERETLTWESFGTASRELAEQIADSGYRPDIILSVARGGLSWRVPSATRSA
jgi:hypoxanthine phosphoribosyltransferase